MIESNLKPSQLAVVFDDPVLRSGPCRVLFLVEHKGAFRYAGGRTIEAWTVRPPYGKLGEPLATNLEVRLVNPEDGVARPGDDGPGDPDDPNHNPTELEYTRDTLSALALHIFDQDERGNHSHSGDPHLQRLASMVNVALIPGTINEATPLAWLERIGLNQGEPPPSRKRRPPVPVEPDPDGPF